MSRKPVDKLRPNESRQAIWEWIRSNEAKNGPLATFALKDLLVPLHVDSMRDYLTGLVAAGFLVMTKGTSKANPNLYTMVKSNGQEAPRVRKDGGMVTQGMAREKMWLAMGINSQKGKSFTIRDLTVASTPEIPIAEVDAKHYCRHLHNAGYLVEVKPGTSGQLTIYRMPFSKWTGPKPVQIQRTRRCFDPNTGLAVHIEIISVEGGE